MADPVAPRGFDPALADADYCYLTTTGRVTGRPHTIEIWFGMCEDASALYLLAGGEGDWLKNLRREPHVTVRVGSRDAPLARATARLVDDPGEDSEARRLLLEKYTSRYGGDLTSWGRTATPVAIEPLSPRPA